VDTAQTATEAVEKLATRRYAAIVTDCVLPDLAPLDWLAAVRRAAPDTSLVLYSGTIVVDELHGLARDWGAAAVLEKPFKPAQLVEAVRQAIATGAKGGIG
jgi:DNA-binding response OmpR family regulator